MKIMKKRIEKFYADFTVGGQGILSHKLILEIIFLRRQKLLPDTKKFGTHSMEVQCLFCTIQIFQAYCSKCHRLHSDY
jgi:hypothetical protein